ncbi:MAG: hypothetical protein Q8R72_00250 [Hylemonella sp.]|nr:hypothetical protein [Hylemonella sp.]
MDEKTLGILVMGGIVVALGVFGAYMEARQQARGEARKQGQVRRLRPLRRRVHTH